MSVPSFRELGVPADLTSILEQRQITAPFPIQAATLPDALNGRDVCGRAPTGSGKTLAFGLALALRTPRARAQRPTALVLVPTRELAAQVERELRPLAGARKLRVATVYGGVGYGPQRNALRRGVDILVACPGRLEDLIEQRELKLEDVSIVVVDEADRMADMGFLPAVRRLLDKSRSDRQTLLFSATLDGDVDVLIKHYQKDPSRHAVATSEEEQGEVEHHFWRSSRIDRLQLTAQIIGQHSPAIVFCRTRHGADRLSKQLGRLGIESAPIHGSRSQPQRERALKLFSDGKVRALVATDVAARGIHVDDVSCVVHYDPPTTHKDYVHRSGRTGRAGANGKVVSLVSPDQDRDIRAMWKQLKMHSQIEAPEKMERVTEKPERRIVHAEEESRSNGHRPNNGHRPGKPRRNPDRDRNRNRNRNRAKQPQR